jgi:hypothetical protein
MTYPPLCIAAVAKFAFPPVGMTGFEWETVCNQTSTPNPSPSCMFGLPVALDVRPRHHSTCHPPTLTLAQ